MIISLNPTYFCNFKCSFCYLTHTQLDDNKLLPVSRLRTMLEEVSRNKQISHIDIYGGEPSLLSVEYWDDMKSVIREFYDGSINVVSNLSRIHSRFLADDITLSVSYDFDCRQAHNSVFNNLMALEKPFSILMLAGDCLVRKNVDEMIHMLNLLTQLESVEIKPYSSNQSNQLSVSYLDFEEFIKKWILSPVSKKFEFINEFNLQDSLAGANNSFSDDHVYITPNGKFSVLEFDQNDNEFFLELDSFEEYLRWTRQEKDRVHMNGFCGTCEYLGTCLSEHLRDVKDISKSCNGFKQLLDWYRDGRV